MKRPVGFGVAALKPTFSMRRHNITTCARGKSQHTQLFDTHIARSVILLSQGSYYECVSCLIGFLGFFFRADVARIRRTVRYRCLQCPQQAKCSSTVALVESSNNSTM